VVDCLFLLYPIYFIFELFNIYKCFGGIFSYEDLKDSLDYNIPKILNNEYIFMMDTNQIKNKSEADIFQCTDEKYNTSKYKEYKKNFKISCKKKIKLMSHKKNNN
jgi:hypothetical protein